MSTKLRTLFSKPVDRPIDGVIKADDEESLLIELEEYVVTNEIEKNISRFLSDYNNYTNKNGIWISGFFGSGKSHLLKMLSLVLEDKNVEGQSAAEIFLKKVSHDAFLNGELERAVKIPSQSVLFNIDQKATIISKEEVDALLAVFQSVFDQTCGYYSEGYIASLERGLDERGVYENFKEEFRKYSTGGISWEDGRELAAFESDAISKAFASVTGQSESASENILDTYSKNYSVSIESFAKQVKKYIDKQDPGFRLNFFVDEVGQYIADNVKLMTNLQTIAESLNTICKGQAWIIVTAQEALDKVVGDITAKQANDFSKIMARFDIRMPLTSKNVAEVIQKRLLSKSLSSTTALQNVYQSESSNFGTLFNFSDGSVDLRNFTDEDNFIQSYPFVPYQYDLFREAIKGLSEHNAFEGKHSSVGERSMLGVFREVVMEIADLELGQLATFDLMFSGIRTALKSSVQTSIQIAEGNLGNDFAVRVLKVLFLVKYYRQFKPTLHNICVLMLDRFDQDISQLRKSVEEALNLLELQTYIQRNGEIYEFLTDEEKDVEEEIKNTDVDRSEISDELKGLVFRDIVSTPKIRHTSGYDYKYAQKIDDELKGQDSELSINIITPFHEDTDNETALSMNSMSTDELLVILPSNSRFMSDLMLYKRTEKYVRQNQRTGLDEVKSRILNEKGSQNSERSRTLKTRLQSMMSQATFIVRGETIEMREGDAKSRIERAFQILIEKVYSNLSMLRGVTYTESDIAKYYTDAKEGMFVGGSAPLTEAEQQIFNHIQSQSKLSVRVTLKSVEEKFERKSFGWSTHAILANVARLCGSHKLEATNDSNQLLDDDLIRSLKSSRDHSNIILQTVSVIPASQIRFLKTFVEDFFDQPPVSTDARGLTTEISNGFRELSNKLGQYTAQSTNIPFLANLSDVKNTLETASQKDFNWVLNDLSKMADDLLDQKENTLDPIVKFMEGAQKTIYEDARQFLVSNRDNFASVGSEKSNEMQEILHDENCYKGNKIQRVNTLMSELKIEISASRDSTVKTSLETVKSLSDQIKSMGDYQSANEQIRSNVDKSFADLENTLKNAQAIDVISVTLDRFEKSTFPELLGSLGGSDVSEVISSTSIKFPKPKSILENEADVNQHVDEYRRAMLDEIVKGKRITI
ncbi:BREX system P-loop protein BrxC [Paracoccaceae bacterium]|nr:BREX system P-loop protein BrxC [Paracoccaceae bacterium]